MRQVRGMTSGSRLVAGGIVAWALVTTTVAAVSHSPSPPVLAQAAQDPAPARVEPPAAFARVCVRCHASERIVQGRRSRSQWEEVVEQMVTRGATGSDEDFGIVIEFLVTEYGRVSINTAAAEDLAQVLHLEAAQAEAIVSYRKTHGPFADFDALVAMPGAAVDALRKRRDAIVF